MNTPALCLSIRVFRTRIWLRLLLGKLSPKEYEKWPFARDVSSWIVFQELEEQNEELQAKVDSIAEIVGGEEEEDNCGKNSAQCAANPGENQYTEPGEAVPRAPARVPPARTP